MNPEEDLNWHRRRAGLLVSLIAAGLLLSLLLDSLAWLPWVTTGGVGRPAYALRAIAAGEHDAYVREWARAAAAWGGPLYLRFAHEMNGDWYPWSVGVNGNTSADYQAAWRHVVDIF